MFFLQRKLPRQALVSRKKQVARCQLFFSTRHVPKEDEDDEEEEINKYRMMFLGAPGVGKGTYASRIAPALKIPTISTGDLVRKEIKDGTELGKKIREYSDKGLLVPDAIILEMVDKRLKEDDAANGFLFDGFPRNVAQAKALDKISKLNLVVSINLPDWILMDKILGRRMCSDCGAGYNVAHINHGEYNMPPLLPKKEGMCDACGGNSLIARADDTEEVIFNRLKVYKTETAPLIKYYSDKGVLKPFEVKRGLKDLNKLIHLIETTYSIRLIESYPTVV